MVEPEESKKKKVKTQLQPEKGGGGKPPRPTTVGLGGNDDDDPNFHPGDLLSCEVLEKTTGGYTLKVKGKYKGFVSTLVRYKVGTVVLFVFLRTENGECVMADQSSSNAFDLLASKEVVARAPYKDLDAKQKVEVANNLMVPPIDRVDSRTVSLDILKDALAKEHTGVVKSTDKSANHSATALLYKGRVVGCIAVDLETPDTESTEKSLATMLEWLKDTLAEIELYSLPELLVLPFSSLFLGYPVSRRDEYNGLEYLDYFIEWAKQDKSTATLCASLTTGVCFGLIYKGKFTASFDVESQNMEFGEGLIKSLLEREPGAPLGVTILPPEMTSSKSEFGFEILL